MLILQTYICKPLKQFFLFIVEPYLALVGYPLVISVLAPPTLSAPQLLMASQTRDRLDVGSHSPRSEPLDGAGGGADGAAIWTGGLLCSESKCVAQSSWSSVCRDTEHKVISRNNRSTNRSAITRTLLCGFYRVSTLSSSGFYSTCLCSTFSRLLRSAPSSLWWSSSSSQRLFCSSLLSLFSTSSIGVTSYRANTEPISILLTKCVTVFVKTVRWWFWFLNHHHLNESGSYNYLNMAHRIGFTPSLRLDLTAAGSSLWLKELWTDNTLSVSSSAWNTHTKVWQFFVFGFTSHKSNTVHHHVCHSFGFSSNDMINSVNILLCSWCKVVNTTRIQYKICCIVPPM